MAYTVEYDDAKLVKDGKTVGHFHCIRAKDGEIAVAEVIINDTDTATEIFNAINRNHGFRRL